MILELKKSSKFEAELFLDNVDVFDSIDFNIKRNLFDSALSKIDAEITEIAELSKDDRDGLYLWCLTYDVYRADGIIGIVFDYYLIEIIKYLVEKYSDLKEISISKAVSKPFSDLLAQETNLLVFYNSSITGNIRVFVRYKFGPLKRVLSICLYSYKYRKSEIEKLPKNSVLILKNFQRSFVRWKGFPDELLGKFENLYVLDTSLFRIKNYVSDKEILINPFRILVFLNALRDTIKFVNYKRNFFKKNNSNFNGFATYIKNESLLQSFYIKLKSNAYQELFDKLKPDCVVVSSTFGDPHRRMPLIFAKRIGIKTILFSCRPFLTRMRSEDRLIASDLSQCGNSTVGDQIVIFDKPSYDHLIKSGVEKGKINYYYPKKNNIELNNSDRHLNCILLLFAHESFNDDLIDLLYDIKENRFIANKILYREHPNDKLTEKQLVKLRGICPSIFSISNKFWYELQFENVLALTSNSTSGIDALTRGCSLLWLPFLTEHSVQFAEMMDKIGCVATTKSDFFKFVTDYSGDSHFARYVDLKCNSDMLEHVLTNSN